MYGVITSVKNNTDSSNILYELLRSSVDQSRAENIDFKSLTYAIYARKSTVGDERQEHSIEDQIALCVEREVKPNGLNTISPIREKGSAKEPDIRPKFRQLVEDIKNGKIDGIISYHPDRLSRNMKEAGELIDLLDKGILKDLRFATSSFENSPTGKMLLGISFVLSKQYSENLSQVVTRGNVRAAEERGEFIGKRVHGYLITKDRRLLPDGANFIVLRGIFEKRLEGMSQPDIAKWANTQGYHVRRRGRDPEPFIWDKSTISKVLRDPVYAGVLKFGKSVSRLSDHYDFTQAISENDFLKINKAENLTSAKIVSSYQGVKSGNIRADLLRGIVFCSACEKPMTSGITSKKNASGEKSEYYYYRCESVACLRRGRSVRAKVIVNFAIGVLNRYLFTTEANYQHYKTEARELMAERRIELDKAIGLLSKQLGEKRLEYRRAKDYVLHDADGLGKHFDLDQVKKELDDIEGDLRKLTTQRSELKDTILTYDKYLELFSKIGDLIEANIAKSVNMSALDAILRKFFSNFTVEIAADRTQQSKVVSYKLKEPWQGFIDSNNVVDGRGERTRTSGLLVPNQAR